MSVWNLAQNILMMVCSTTRCRVKCFCFSLHYIFGGILNGNCLKTFVSAHKQMDSVSMRSGYVNLMFQLKVVILYCFCWCQHVQ